MTAAETRDPLGVAISLLEACAAVDRPALVARLTAEGYDPDELQEALDWVECAEDEADDAVADEDAAATAGRYLQIFQGHGRGAQGSVDVAFDQYLLRHVAIKRFHRTRFFRVEEARREAAALARVLHPAVATVFDLVETDDAFGIVMQLSAEADVRGGLLAPEHIGKPLASGDADGDDTLVPTSPEEACRWIADVAEGLAQVHTKEVFHRDIKPENILVTPRGREPMLVDFGIAVMDHVAFRGAPGWSPLAKDNAREPSRVDRVGTLAWMAPEVASREAPNTVESNRLIDIYSLGATLYTLLAGHPPHCEHEASRDQGELLLLRQRELHTPLHRLPEPRWRIDARLSAIVEKATDFDPSSRYSTASELAADLRAYLAGDPTSLDSEAYRFVSYSRRHPALASLGATIFLTSILLAATVPAKFQLQNLDADRERLEVDRNELLMQDNAFGECEKDMAALERPTSADIREVFNRCRLRIHRARHLWNQTHPVDPPP
ncbi:MAG: serine/threonine-protein kinase [Myxococcota bacterium]